MTLFRFSLRWHRYKKKRLARDHFFRWRSKVSVCGRYYKETGEWEWLSASKPLDSWCPKCWGKLLDESSKESFR